MTLEQLIQAIRDATDLKELKRLVGPNANEESMAISRLAHIEHMWNMAEENGWGVDPSKWPYPHCDEYKRVMEDQDEYESIYG